MPKTNLKKHVCWVPEHNGQSKALKSDSARNARVCLAQALHACKMFCHNQQSLNTMLISGSFKCVWQCNNSNEYTK